MIVYNDQVSNILKFSFYIWATVWVRVKDELKEKETRDIFTSLAGHIVSS